MLLLCVHPFRVVLFLISMKAFAYLFCAFSRAHVPSFVRHAPCTPCSLRVFFTSQIPLYISLPSTACSLQPQYQYSLSFHHFFIYTFPRGCPLSSASFSVASTPQAQRQRDKHNCRMCGLLVCHPCSRHRKPLPRMGVLEPSRVCDRCYYGTEPSRVAR